MKTMEELKYIEEDDCLDIKRKKWGKGFTYLDKEGKTIKDDKVREHIEELSIPPAWKEVRISSDKRSHIQAKGKDKSGRLQYVYHPSWEEIRNKKKFNEVIKFAEQLPEIRQKVEEDIKQSELQQNKILATIVWILDKTLVRIGNKKYSQRNDSFGVTTLREKHLKISGQQVEFKFTAKSGKKQQIKIFDDEVVEIIKQLHHLPGYEVFKYLSDGETKYLYSEDVNEYLYTISGKHFTSKNFRTWGGTYMAANFLYLLGAHNSKKEAEENISSVINNVAHQLGNTPSISRNYYVHPKVLESYKDGRLTKHFNEYNHKTQSHYKEGEFQTLTLLKKT